MPFVNEGVESFAILAIVLVRIEMPNVDTNLHSSTVDEDGNDQGVVLVLSGMVSEDGQKRLECVTRNITCHNQCDSNTSSICYTTC